MKIILAVLSFRRLENKYQKAYKGGILLIDELDATLHSFSQKKLVDFLYTSAENYRIQVVFTTHSPIILDYISRKQKSSRLNQCPRAWHDWAIVHLEPEYDFDGTRIIQAKNVTTRSGMLNLLSMIDLTYSQDGHIHVYCEDHVAICFLRYVLEQELKIIPDHYMEFINVNLGWPNYLDLVRKNIPEFTKNIIVLDADVLENKDFKSSSNYKTFEESKNFLILPLTVEKDMFVFLKDTKTFNEFRLNISRKPDLKFEILFNEWPHEPGSYKTPDFKAWYKYALSIVRDESILFEFWCRKNPEKISEFCTKFKKAFNELAEKRDLDCLP